MRRVGRQSTDEPDHANAEREEQPPREARHAPVLALQRTAGNAAVTGWLRSTTAATLARRRNLPEDADSLAEVASAAKDITIDSTEVRIGSLKDWLTASRGRDRNGLAVDVRVPDPVGRPDASDDTVGKIRKALIAIGMSFFNLTDKATQAAKLDVVRFADLDFNPFGGVDGHYRFTCVTRTPKQGKNDARIDLIIELVRAVRPAFKAWAAMDSARRTQLENRFTKFGFTQAQPDALTGKVVDVWSNDQFGYVLQALEAIPDATLAAVSGIEWERGHGKRGPTGEAGHFTYDPNKGTRRLQIYDDAFTSLGGLTELVAHEIGHALSLKPPSEKTGQSVASSRAFQDAVKADGGKAITGYAKTNWEEHYSELFALFTTEPETMRVLRPKVFEFFTTYPAGGPPPPPKPTTRSRSP